MKESEEKKRPSPQEKPIIMKESEEQTSKNNKNEVEVDLLSI